MNRGGRGPGFPSFADRGPRHAPGPGLRRNLRAGLRSGLGLGLRAGLALALFAADAPAAAGQEVEDGERPAVVRSDSLVSFDFQAADLRVVINALAEVAGVNITYSALPERPVTLRTPRPVAVSAVPGLLERVARANGLTLERAGGLMRLSAPTPQDRAATEDGPPAGAGAPGAEIRLFVYRLKHVGAETLAATLRALFGLATGFYGGAEASVGSPLSQTLEAQRRTMYERMRPAPRVLPGARTPQVPPGGVPPAAGRPGAVPSGAEAARAQESGIAAILQGPVEIVPDNQTNSILVLASPADYETVSAAIQELDIRPLQVLIEALIVEVRHDESLAIGTGIEVPVDGDGVGFELQGLSAGDLALRVLGIGGIGASAILQVLAANSEVRIVSRPIILAQNNEVARILVGDQRPFIQLFRSLPTDNAVRDQVVQFKNVGTQLTILPTINQDGYVNLEVLQEVSSATAEIQFGAPVINTREAETEVLVKDGHTVVLGGLIDHQRQKSTTGIPLLKEIPIIGGLFGTTSTRDIATELYLLLTPHIIRTDEEMEEATQQVRSASEQIEDRFPESSILDPDPLAIPADSLPAMMPADSAATPVASRRDDG